MSGLETNVFPITNLGQLSARYRLYRIKGLLPQHDEYYQNLAYIGRKLSRELKSPVTTVHRDGVPVLVVRDDGQAPPSSLPLVRTLVVFEFYPGTFQLDFTVRSPENDEICLRFLQFMVQGPLFDHPGLWQPASGQPFFMKRPLKSTGRWVLYRGYSIRAVLLPGGHMGLAVDATSKFVARDPLSAHIERDEFEKCKGTHFVYHYGHQWYEIQPVALSDLNASQYQIRTDGGWTPLLEYVVRESRKPIPPELACVPHDTSVVIYRNNTGQERSAPSTLCYPVLGPNDPDIARQHSDTQIPPHARRQMIHDFVNRHLRDLQFGDARLSLDSQPEVVPARMFVVPDLRFGGSQILSVQGTPGARQVSLDALGSTRLALLKDPNAGFYVREPLDRQYLILPASVFESWGRRFLCDLRQAVDELYPKGGYDPIIVTYNDRTSMTFAAQGHSILEAVRVHCDKPGYGVVMIHYLPDRQLREEDQLAAMVTRELRKLDLCVAIIHSEVGGQSYVLSDEGNGGPEYRPHTQSRGRLVGYLRNVALAKVLLTNQRWPFILETPLNADLTIGIDIKQNTAGLVVVGKRGADIRAVLKTSRQKERLLRDQMKAYTVEVIRSEATARVDPIKTIVIHRDGSTYPSETLGASDGMEVLRREGVIDQGATLTILEILKNSPVRLRLFDVGEKNGRTWVENPQVGNYYVINENDGFVCATGRAFNHPGTTQPLHVRRVLGPLSMEQCLQDIYRLTTLAWTKPDDCVRHPITIKLNDRFLREEAAEYDADALDVSMTLDSEAAA